MTIAEQVREEKQQRLFAPNRKFKIKPTFAAGNDFSFANGDCLDFLTAVPVGAAKLVITSPPYNIGKVYEKN
jgi:adenine-specific DNA-methyltransferase